MSIIDKAFPLKTSVSFTIKQTEVQYGNGGMQLLFEVSKHLTTEPKYDTTIFKYLKFVDDDLDFFKKHTGRLVKSNNSHSIYVTLMMDSRVRQRVAFRTADAVELNALTGAVSTEWTQNGIFS